MAVEAPSATKASFGGVEFLVTSFQTRRGRRVAEYATPGATGSSVEDLGRNAVRDTVSAPLDPETFAKLTEAADKGKISTFGHPLLGSYEALIGDISGDSEGNTVNTIQVSIEFIEASAQPILLGVTISRDSAKQSADASFGTFGDLFDGIDLTLTVFDDLEGFVDSFKDAYNATSDFFESTTQAFQDLSRAAQDVVSFGQSVIDEVRNVADTIGDIANEMIDTTLAVVDGVRTVVDTVAAEVEQVYTFTTMVASDLPSILQRRFIDPLRLEEILDANGLIDPFFIPAGVALDLPL